MSDLDSQEAQTAPVGQKSLAVRIFEYPLVALVIGVATFVLTIGVSGAAVEIPVRMGTLQRDVILQTMVMLVAVVLAYKFVISRLGAPKRDDLRKDHAVRDTSVGLAAAFLLFSAIVFLAWILGVYRIVGWGSTNSVMIALITTGLFPAVNEEILFRGIIFRWLEEFGGSWLALLISSLLFGAAHLMNPNASWIAAAGIAVEAGVMLGAAYMLTRSLWLAIGLHAGWNLTQGLVYDIPVSGLDQQGLVDARLEGNPLLTGGSFGLEASVIAMIMALLFGLYLLNRARRAGQFMKPIWARSPAPPKESQPDDSQPLNA